MAFVCDQDIVGLFFNKPEGIIFDTNIGCMYNRETKRYTTGLIFGQSNDMNLTEKEDRISIRGLQITIKFSADHIELFNTTLAKFQKYSKETPDENLKIDSKNNIKFVKNKIKPEYQSIYNETMNNRANHDDYNQCMQAINASKNENQNVQTYGFGFVDFATCDNIPYPSNCIIKDEWYTTTTDYSDFNISICCHKYGSLYGWITLRHEVGIAHFNKWNWFDMR